MLTLPPLSLYVHTPWCVRKCPYCDFNSHESRGELPEDAYLDALRRDLAHDLPLVQGRKLRSIFIGGGTPSLMSPQFMAALLAEIEREIGFEADIEITMEANPGTFEQDKFRAFRRAGINRLSMGIQSFQNRHLKALGRIHDRASALTAAASARAAGFDNFNLDLMHGLPDQTPAEALADLQLAIELAPAHISWYQLTIEPNTQFYKRPPQLPDEDNLDSIQQQGLAALAAAGYRQYEVSAFCRPGKQSRHNTNYWQFGDYLGIGAGAHGKITRPGNGDILRTAKTRLPDDYLARDGDFLAAHHSIDPSELPLEFMMNALRLVEGSTVADFQARTGLSWQSVAETWADLQRRQLVTPTAETIAATPLGFRFLDSVLAQFNLD